MQFVKESLVEACDYVIDHIETREAGRKKAYQEYQAAQEEIWCEQQLPRFKEYRDRLSKLLRTGKAIRGRDLPYHPAPFSPERDVHSFEWNGVTYTYMRDSQHDLELARELRSVLNYVEDGPVLASELNKVGYNTKNLAVLLGRIEMYKAEEQRAKKERDHKEAAKFVEKIQGFAGE